MYCIAVCDDEFMDCRHTIGLTREIMDTEGIACEISQYTSSTALLAAIRAGSKYQLLLLDVMMDGLDGMNLAAALREAGDGTSIVFISSNRDMALKGYEVAASRYLAKPIQADQLREALLHCYRMYCEQAELLLSTERGQSRIHPADIVYAESWKRGSRLKLVNGFTETTARISELAASLPERNFTFCHRTILVNLAFVKHLRSQEIELKDGSILPVSKYRLSEVKKRLLNYLHS